MTPPLRRCLQSCQPQHILWLSNEQGHTVEVYCPGPSNVGESNHTWPSPGGLGPVMKINYLGRSNDVSKIIKACLALTRLPPRGNLISGSQLAGAVETPPAPEGPPGPERPTRASEATEADVDLAPLPVYPVQHMISSQSTHRMARFLCSRFVDCVQ